MNHWIERAHHIAETVLLPAANTVDAEGKIPPGHFEALAVEGFYGINVPPELGGPDLSVDDRADLLEVLHGACLATAFTWAQHGGLVNHLATSPNAALRDTYWNGLLNGSIKGGISGAGAAPQPPLLYARRTDDGYVLNGMAPFVTGWNIIDVMLILARDELDDSIVEVVVDARSAEGMSVQTLPLIAARASNTVRIRFENFQVPADRVCNVITRDEFMAGETLLSRFVASMPIGIARRCLAGLEERDVDTANFMAQLATVRDHLNATLSGDYDLHVARAEALALAVRAATALVAATGSSSSVKGNTAERLVRESMLAMVVGSRPEVRAALLDQFTAAAPLASSLP
ncbi:acyl-CoA dehydrogenase family protein [Rhodococcus sp. WMMA185]|uniref:acyl-CoA dehydrogenase family protein n=1 Tax=Rhodococcus sp. WMMA185 TaxID=679318 RepID=UPI0008791DCC|nr:acyl-CoA dehydrogenase family protein [Rhodococcus sp. WMMA185]